MKQLKTAFADAERNYLEAAAKRNGRNLSEEIRVRIRASIGTDALDAESKSLGTDVARIAADIRAASKWDDPSSAVGWHNDVNLHRALVVAVTEWLEVLAPPTATSSKLNIDPVTLGRTTAQALKRDRSEASRLHDYLADVEKDGEALARANSLKAETQSKARPRRRP